MAFSSWYALTLTRDVAAELEGSTAWKHTADTAGREGVRAAGMHVQHMAYPSWLPGKAAASLPLL